MSHDKCNYPDNVSIGSTSLLDAPRRDGEIPQVCNARSLSVRLDFKPV